MTIARPQWTARARSGVITRPVFHQKDIVGPNRAWDDVDFSSKVQFWTKMMQATAADLFVSVEQPITILRSRLGGFITPPKTVDGDEI